MQKALVQYLRHVKNLESLLYTQDLVIASLTRTAQTLAIARSINEERKKAYRFSENHPFSVPFISIIALVITSILAYKPIWTRLKDDYIAPSGNYYWGKNASEHMMKALALCIFIGLVVGVVVFLVIKIVEFIDKGRRQHRLDVEFSLRVKQATQKEASRIKHELMVKQTILNQIESVKQEQGRTRTVLHQLYNMDILAEKYRSLVPVSMICEYLELGRCYQLKGHEGAYNIYEYERRMDIIITQLEDIKTKLDEIRENQYALYEIMTQANNTLARIDRTNSRILNSIESISRNAELIEFNTRANAEITKATGEFLIMKELLSN